MSVTRNRFRPTGLLVGVSLSLASIVSMPAPAAAACQAGETGCVLPVGTSPPPVVTPTTSAPVYVDDEGGGGIGLLPILIGLAALGALLYFLVLNDDDDEAPISP